jgi:Icc-related predicted phosphoesterase
VKIQILSDLHVDVYPIKPVTIVPGVDAVVVAGDTCEGVLKAFEHLRRLVPIGIPIVMLLGNHEFYRRFVPNELAAAREQAPAYNSYILENNTVTLGTGTGVRFVGATLWTDYLVLGEHRQAAAMSTCAKGMNDHRLIGWQKNPWRRFRPQEAARLHVQSNAFIAETLGTSFPGPTVVVSHHAVHWNSIHPQFRDDLLTSAFLSDKSELIEVYQPNLWIHGHVHNSSDYHIGRTRIVCNPHGYGAENPAFNGALVVEIEE